MESPEKNYEMILAVLANNTEDFIKAVRNHQSVRGISGALRFSDDPKLQQMLVVVDTMDAKAVSREKIADIFEENDFSIVTLKMLCLFQPEELDQKIDFIKSSTRSNIPL